MWFGGVLPMGLDMAYSDGKSQVAVRFSDGEWACLARIQELAPRASSLLFDVPDFGQAVSVDSAELSAALDEILQVLNDRRDLLPATYQYRMENWMGTGLRGEWTGGAASGIRLPGDEEHTYFIEANRDGCWLEKSRLDNRKRVSRDNIDHLKVLETTTCGRIDIRRRSSATALRKKLQQVREFVSAARCREIMKLLG